MKKLFSFLICCCFFSFYAFEDFYKIDIKNIDGEKINLNNFKGKKILIITLPVTDNDSSLSMLELSKFEEKYYQTLIIIGIPSEEFGYKSQDKSKMKQLSKEQKPNFILGEGMKVKKTKGAEQSFLFQWLTNKDKNRHFDQDVIGAGHKFFVDEIGELYAVMGPNVKLADPVMDRILSKPYK